MARGPSYEMSAIGNGGCEEAIFSAMTHIGRITVKPEQCGGRACIRGMRIRVKDVLDLLAAGVPESEILQDYPYLEPEDIRATLEYAAAQPDHPVLKSA